MIKELVCIYAYKQQAFISTALQTEKFKIKADSVFDEGPLPGSWTAAFSLGERGRQALWGLL